MSEPAFYSAMRARRSLLHFLGGKVLSAATGIVFLVWVVRITPTAQYGLFVALLALLEVFYLATGFGLSTMAQRYVAEYRMQAPRAQFQRFVRMLLRRRLWSAILGAAAVALAWPVLTELLRIELPAATRWWVAFWLVVGSGTRFLDEVLPALLLQGTSQLLSTLTNLLRLACLGGIGALGLTPDHLSLIRIEVGVATMVWVCGLWVLRLHLEQEVGTSSQTGEHHNAAMWPVSMRFFIVQLLGQAWSPNMARLLVARLAGAVHTASFGFSQALVDTLRNYLPTYLLASWVRPLMVARFVATGRIESVLDMAGVVFKLSLITLVPFIGLLAVHGDALARWVSAGRYGDGAGQLMAALVVLLALQCLHLCLGMICATLERATANVWATAGCAGALPLAWSLWPALGLLAVPVALGVAEVLWVVWVGVGLRRAGFAVALDWWGVSKVLGSGAFAAVAMASWPPVVGSAVLWPAAAAVLVTLGACVVLRPLTTGERGLVAKVLPRRWVLL